MFRPGLMRIFAAAFLMGITSSMAGTQDGKPLRIAVAGVTHGHLWEVISRTGRGDFEIVGVYEKDDYYREHNGLRGKVDDSLFFSDLDEMLKTVKPEAVVAYGSTYDHLHTVETCAENGVDVMVEKPLAVNLKHARRIEKAAKAHGIMVLTNYETSWYSTNHEAFRPIKDEEAIGDITRIMVYDGHQGPVEIGCGPEFLQWLTDPVLNYLKAAVRGEIEVKPFDLASLENNMIVMEILDAAVKSAKTGTPQGKSR